MTDITEQQFEEFFGVSPDRVRADGGIEVCDARLEDLDTYLPYCIKVTAFKQGGDGGQVFGPDGTRNTAETTTHFIRVIRGEK